MSREEGKIELSEAGEADNEFLYLVYASTRADEVKSFGWDAPQAEAFLKMQFALRKRSYGMQFPAAVTYIVLFDGTQAGSMIVDRNDEHVSLTDIAILMEFRGKGIATQLIRELQREAAAKGQSLNLSVDKNNPRAFKLYETLGFVVAYETDLNYSMQWKA